MQAEDSDPTIMSGSSQPRKWDWIFRALHSVSGRRQNSISMSIPDTVLFANGQPTKWLTTLADGRVARQMLPSASNYSSRDKRSSRAGAPKVNEQLILEQIKWVHDSAAPQKLTPPPPSVPHLTPPPFNPSSPPSKSTSKLRKWRLATAANAVRL